LKIPKDLKVRNCVANHLSNKIRIFCYQAFRLFQNLPTRGQRTKANGNSLFNLNPYKHLRVNMSFYHSFEVEYKRRELTFNERFTELKAYMKAQEEKEKMKKKDKRQSRIKSKQDFIRNQKIKQ
jgi:hypothetical protein